MKILELLTQIEPYNNLKRVLFIYNLLDFEKGGLDRIPAPKLPAITINK